MSPKEAARVDPQQRLVLECAVEVLDDAGRDAAALAGGDTAVVVGASTHDYFDLQQRRLATANAYSMSGSAVANTANRVSHFLDLRGPSLAVDTACSSALTAVRDAARAAQRHGARRRGESPAGPGRVRGVLAGVHALDERPVPALLRAGGRFRTGRGRRRGRPQTPGRGARRRRPGARGRRRRRFQRRRPHPRAGAAERPGAGRPVAAGLRAGGHRPRRGGLRRGPWNGHAHGRPAGVRGPGQGAGAPPRIRPAHRLGEVQRGTPGGGGRSGRAPQGRTGAAGGTDPPDPARAAAERGHRLRGAGPGTGDRGETAGRHRPPGGGGQLLRVRRRERPRRPRRRIPVGGHPAGARRRPHTGPDLRAHRRGPVGGGPHLGRPPRRRGTRRSVRPRIHLESSSPIRRRRPCCAKPSTPLPPTVTDGNGRWWERR